MTRAYPSPPPQAEGAQRGEAERSRHGSEGAQRGEAERSPTRARPSAVSTEASEARSEAKLGEASTEASEARSEAQPSEVNTIVLGSLRERAAALRSARALRRLARALASDARAGALLLGARCSARAAAQEREERRLARLFALRARLMREGATRVAGVDEVGVGPLAGPVVAAAVVLAGRPRLPGLDDSKRLSAAERERLDREIRAQAEAVGIAEVWPEEIDRLNIYRAALEAMRRAVLALGAEPHHVLVDARTIPGIRAPQTPIVGGDGRDASIAAASIVAKVHRDALMRRLDATHPGYGFASHMGYATPEHLAALARIGASPIHRRSFAPVSQLRLFPTGR